MIDLSRVLIYAAVYAFVLFLALLIPIVLGVREAYSNRKRVIEIVEQLNQKGQIREEMMKTLLKDLGKEPEGIRGFGRMLMTLGVLIIVGISIFHVLVLSTSLADIGFLFSNSTSSSSFNQTLTLTRDLKTQQLSMVNSLLTILGGAVSAIIGFYFGTKAAEKDRPEK